MLVLIGQNNGLEGKRFLVKKEMVVGRSRACDLFLADGRASRKQARFYRNDDNILMMEDLNSLNGCLCNGELIKSKELEEGDLLKLGSTEFVVQNFEPQVLLEVDPETSQQAPDGIVESTLKNTADHSRQIQAQLLRSDLPPLMRKKLSARAKEQEQGVASAVRRLNPKETIEPNTFKPGAVVELIDLPVESKLIKKQATSIDVEDVVIVSETSIEAFQKKAKIYALLFEVSSLVQKSTKSEALLPELMRQLLSTMGGDYGYIALLNSENDLETRAAFQKINNDHGEEEYIELSDSFLLSRTVCGYLLEEQCGVLAPDLRNDLRFSKSQSVIMGPSNALIAAPIILGADSRGVLAISFSESKGHLSEDLLELLCILGNMVGSAIENFELAMEKERYLLELEHKNKQLVETQAQLIQTEKMAMIGRLSSGVIHEVKNHLSPLMLADMVAEQYPEDEDIQEMSEMVIEARDRIIDLVDEIRRFAAGDEQGLNLLPHDPVDLLQRVARFVRCDASIRSVEFNVVAGKIQHVLMDGNRMRQVLINLIQNASHAVQDCAQPKIDLVADQNETHLIYMVKDNGVGIPQDILDRVFDPLFTTKGDKGLGLGLDICRRIVQAHNGQLSCRSKPNKGTVFKVLIPLEPPEFDI